MTQEEKQLLLKDLCARLPYRVICVTTSVYYDNDDNEIGQVQGRLVSINKHGASFIDDRDDTTFGASFENNGRIGFKPYLRPMSSMTNEEWCEYCDSCAEDEKEVIITYKGYRIVPTTHKEHFFNIHHFDYRSLIEKGLALEAPEEMYKTE